MVLLTQDDCYPCRRRLLDFDNRTFIQKPVRTLRTKPGLVLDSYRNKMWSLVSFFYRDVRWITFLVICGLFVDNCAGAAFGHSNMGDGCDWTGSGLDSPSGRGVQPVYLRCSQGQIKWLYPRGGLRVLLRSSASVSVTSSTQTREFRGCIKADKSFAGARIFLEEPGRLQPLFGTDDGKTSALKRCFRSRNGQAALYVEASPSQVQLLERQVASFHYDLEPLPKEAILGQDDECRPCSEEELLRVYCTSDFVVRGTINNIDNNEVLQRSEITITADRVIRQIVPVFQQPDSFRLFNSIVGTADDVETLSGTVHVPINCEVKHSPENFLFMGRLRLGETQLLCATRISDWQKLAKRAEKEGSLQCELET